MRLQYSHFGYCFFKVGPPPRIQYWTFFYITIKRFKSTHLRWLQWLSPINTWHVGAHQVCNDYICRTLPSILQPWSHHGRDLGVVMTKLSNRLLLLPNARNLVGIRGICPRYVIQRQMVAHEGLSLPYYKISPKFLFSSDLATNFRICLY